VKQFYLTAYLLTNIRTLIYQTGFKLEWHQVAVALFAEILERL